MRKSKPAIVFLAFKALAIILILTVVGLFIQQNYVVFQSPQAFSLELYGLGKGVSHLTLVNLLFMSALVGFIGGIALMLRPYLRVRRLLAAQRAAKLKEAPGPLLPAGHEATAGMAATAPSERQADESPTEEESLRTAGS